MGPVAAGLTAWLTTAGSAGLLTALGGVFLFVLLRKFVKTPYALATTIGVFLGSLPFPYAIVLFSHGMVVGLLSIALWSALRPSRLPEYHLCTGFFAALAVITEYPAAIAAVGIFLLLKFRPKPMLFFALGAIPPLVFLCTYNYVAFDSFFSLGYEHVEGWSGMKQGLYGVQFLPKPGAFQAILVGGKQGIFVWSPFFILALPGFLKLWTKNRWLAAVSFLVICTQIILMSSYSYWDGGNAVGPRHLSPILPFFAIPTAYGVAAFPRLASALITLSLLLIGGATLAEPLVPPMQNPIWGFYIPKYVSGSLEQNWAIALGLPPLLSAAWFFALEFTAIGFLLRSVQKKSS